MSSTAAASTTVFASIHPPTVVELLNPPTLADRHNNNNNNTRHDDSDSSLSSPPDSPLRLRHDNDSDDDDDIMHGHGDQPELPLRPATTTAAAAAVYNNSSSSPQTTVSLVLPFDEPAVATTTTTTTTDIVQLVDDVLDVPLDEAAAEQRFEVRITATTTTNNNNNNAFVEVQDDDDPVDSEEDEEPPLVLRPKQRWRLEEKKTDQLEVSPRRSVLVLPFEDENDPDADEDDDDDLLVLHMAPTDEQQRTGCLAVVAAEKRDNKEQDTLEEDDNAPADEFLLDRTTAANFRLDPAATLPQQQQQLSVRTPSPEQQQQPHDEEQHLPPVVSVHNLSGDVMRIPVGAGFPESTPSPEQQEPQDKQQQQQVSVNKHSRDEMRIPAGTIVPDRTRSPEQPHDEQQQHRPVAVNKHSSDEIRISVGTVVPDRTRSPEQPHDEREQEHLPVLVSVNNLSGDERITKTPVFPDRSRSPKQQQQPRDEPQQQHLPVVVSVNNHLSSNEQIPVGTADRTRSPELQPQDEQEPLPVVVSVNNYLSGDEMRIPVGTIFPYHSRLAEQPPRDEQQQQQLPVVAVSNKLSSNERNTKKPVFPDRSRLPEQPPRDEQQMPVISSLVRATAQLFLESSQLAAAVTMESVECGRLLMDDAGCAPGEVLQNDHDDDDSIVLRAGAGDEKVVRHMFKNESPLLSELKPAASAVVPIDIDNDANKQQVLLRHRVWNETVRNLSPSSSPRAAMRSPQDCSSSSTIPFVPSVVTLPRAAGCNTTTRVLSIVKDVEYETVLLPSASQEEQDASLVGDDDNVLARRYRDAASFESPTTAASQERRMKVVGLVDSLHGGGASNRTRDALLEPPSLRKEGHPKSPDPDASYTRAKTPDYDKDFDTVGQASDQLSVISLDHSGWSLTDRQHSRTSRDPEPITDGLPLHLSPLDNDIGIPKGDVMISLLVVDGDDDWAHRTHQAVLRCRTMRRNCDSKWKRTKLERGGKSSSQVDADADRGVGGMMGVSVTQTLAVQHLKYDELEDALVLYEDILDRYYVFAEELASRRGDSVSQNLLARFQPYIGSALHNVGLVHMLRGDFEQAFTFFDRATTKRELVLGRGHGDHLSSFARKIICQFALEDFGNARTELLDALELFREKVDSLPDRRQCAEILNNLACMRYMCDEPKKAIPLFRESLDMQLSVAEESLYCGSKFSCHASALNISVTTANIGFLALISRDIPKAISSFQSAYKEQSLLISDAHVTLTCTMDHLCVAHLLAGNRSRSLQIDAFGRKDPRCQLTASKIEMIEDQDNPEKLEAALQAIPYIESRSGKEKKSIALFRVLKNPRRKISRRMKTDRISGKEH